MNYTPFLLVLLLLVVGFLFFWQVYVAWKESPDPLPNPSPAPTSEATTLKEGPNLPPNPSPAPKSEAELLAEVVLWLKILAGLMVAHHLSDRIFWSMN